MSPGYGYGITDVMSSSKTAAGDTARASLVTKGWTITDDGGV